MHHISLSDIYYNEEALSIEESFILSLRPKELKNYIGQENLKEKLKVLIKAAKKRKEACEHILFYGPPVRLSDGPDVLTRRVPISLAIICARVVLPNPGGP